MFFPSRVFAQQNEPSYTSRYRGHMQTTNYLGGYDNSVQQNVYPRMYDYSYKPESTYNGSSLYKPSSIDQTTRYFGNDRVVTGSVSKYYSKPANNDLSRQNQTSFYQFKSRYDKYDDSSLESRYGLKLTNDRTYYNPTTQYNRIQSSQQFQNNQNTFVFQNNQGKSKGRNQEAENAFELSISHEGKRKQKRSKSVNITPDYKGDFCEQNQGGNTFRYQSQRDNQDTEANFSVIAEKYGNLQKKKDQTGVQRKYPAILTNETPLFQAEDHSESSQSYSDDSLSGSNSSSESDSDCEKTSHKKHKKEELRPFDPNRQLFSQAQNDIFQQYAEQRINEIRAQRGQPPIKSQPKAAQQNRSVQPESFNDDRYGINAQLKECEKQKQSKSRKTESKKRQPEVKFAFKSHEDIQEQKYGSQKLGTSVTFAPDVHNLSSMKQQKSSNVDNGYQFESKFEDNENSKEKKEKSKASPKQHKSSSHKDKDDTADIMSKLNKFRKTIEESKRTERQLGELLGFKDKPGNQTKVNENSNNNQTDKEMLVSGKNGQPEFQSEPSLIFEDN